MMLVNSSTQTLTNKNGKVIFFNFFGKSDFFIVFQSLNSDNKITELQQHIPVNLYKLYQELLEVNVVEGVLVEVGRYYGL